jgi:hypothetical protein
MTEFRWTQAPPHSSWGEFGPNDQLGRMNYVDRHKVLQGIAEVKEGRTFCLSLPLDYPGGSVLNPRRKPPVLYSTVATGPGGKIQNYCRPLGGADGCCDTDVICDDVVALTLQYSTQWDSFAHVGSRFDCRGVGQDETVFYNGYRGGTDIMPGAETDNPAALSPYQGPQAKTLGIQNLAEHGAQGRGVMIDLHRHFGNARKRVGYDDLMTVLEKDHVVVEKGDMVCLYTGFGDVIMGMNRNADGKVLHSVCAGLDGEDNRLLQWIGESGLACLIADNYAVELISESKDPAVRGPRMPLHEFCLFKNGIHLGELWYLSELALWLREHDRSRFLLTAPPLRLPGAVGSPATQIATV